MKAFDKKEWTKAKTAQSRSSNTVKAATQALIEMGLSHYQESGDTVFLTEAMHACEGQRSLPNDSIKKYIAAHANVRWVVSSKKEGDKSIRVARFKKQGSDVEVTEPLCPWWEHEANSDNVAKPMNLDNAITALIKRAKTALENNKVENIEAAKERLAQLEALVA